MGLTSKLVGGDLGGLASLAGEFKEPGLDSDMIAKFVPLVLSLVQSRGGDRIKGLL